MRWQDRIPLRWRTRLQVMKRKIRDRQAAYTFAQPNGISKIDFPFHIQLAQIVKPSHLFENKLHNIDLAAQRINQILIPPEAIFSFWKVIGQPSQRNGFKAGRNLVGGNLVEGFGGGLCQLSGLIYHLSLLADFELIERHAHSVDIYREEERYTPLGADATVVYGYKDLRIKNGYPFPVKFEVEQTSKNIIGRIISTELINQQTIQFIRHRNGAWEEVQTYSGEESAKRLLHTVSYKKI